MANNDYSHSNKSIVLITAEYIGAVILTMVFITLLYGVFYAGIPNLLNQFYEWLIETLIPIGKICLLIVLCVVLGMLVLVSISLIPDLVPVMRSFLVEIIMDNEYDRAFIEFEKPIKHSPTPQVEDKKIDTLPTPEQKTVDNVNRGGAIILALDTENGAEFKHVFEGSSEHLELMAKGARLLGKGVVPLERKRSPNGNITSIGMSEMSQEARLQELKHRIMAKPQKSDVDNWCNNE